MANVRALKTPRNWWNAKKGEVHGIVLPYVRTVENSLAEMFDKFVKLESTYDTNPRTNRATSDRLAAQRTGRAKAIVTENLIASNVDTVAAIVADSDIRVRVQTDGADWSHQRTAKWLEHYGDGLYKLFEVPAKCHTGFKAGASMKGTGLNKIWIDQFKQIQVTPVPIDNIIVDELESRDGKPRQLHYRDFYDREDLMAQFPEYADQIEASQREGSWRRWAGYRPIQSNEIVVIESWRLPIGPIDHERHIPGRHTLTIDGCDLLDEPYEKQRFPFSLMRWNAPIWGFYGISLAERILPHQNLLNRRNYQINRSLDRKADPVTYVKQADQNLAAKTVDQIGAVAVYKDQVPVTVDHQAVGQETYDSRREIKTDAAGESGVNAQMQSGGVPAGIESGVGVREVRSTRTQRFAQQEKAYEQFQLDTIWHILDCCKDLGDDAPEILHVSKFGNRTIKWREVDMDDLKIELTAAATLGDTPAGRQQRVVELAQSGVITLDESRKLMDHPDIERIISLYNAAIEDIENTIERIKEGERVTPEPYQNLNVGVRMLQQEYLLISKQKNVPEEVLEALTDWISIAAGILNPPQVPGAPADQSTMPQAPPSADPRLMPSGPAQAAFAPGGYAPMPA